MTLSEERLAELRALPDRELLDEIFHIAGFEKVSLAEFRRSTRGYANPETV